MSNTKIMGICPGCGGTFRDLDAGDSYCLHCHEDTGAEIAIVRNSGVFVADPAGLWTKIVNLINADIEWMNSFTETSSDPDALNPRQKIAQQIRAALGIEGE